MAIGQGQVIHKSVLELMCVVNSSIPPSTAQLGEKLSFHINISVHTVWQALSVLRNFIKALISLKSIKHPMFPARRALCPMCNLIVVFASI